MNFRYVFHQIGNILKVEAALLVLPLLVAFIYGEATYFAFLVPIALSLVIGFFLSSNQKINHVIYAKEGFAIVGLAWIFVSLIGCLPYVISGQIPRFVDAFFETVSGFTTTGASILTNVETLSRSLQFWRSFAHWIGGMGILVFVIAFLPQTNARSMFVLKAESPGPKIGKIVSKVQHTARILYGIYFVMTLVQIILLAVRIPLFDSITYTFATAGTGGFSIHNTSVAFYQSVYVEVVITVFMFLFGINFTVFYLILIGNVKNALKSEELRWYFLFMLGSILLIAWNVLPLYSSFGESLRYSSFQVSSIMTTTGFSSFDFDTWPTFSKLILILLMFVGASAGSTAGGIKISRIIIYAKLLLREIRYALHPRQVSTISFEKKPIDEGMKKGLSTYLIGYILILSVATLLVSLEGKDLITTFTSVVASFNNVGPGLGMVGPIGNYSHFTDLSKLTLTFTMLAGRLEIFPILILLSPKIWKKE